MLKRFVPFAALMFIATTALGAERVLIVTGEDYKGHHWQKTTPVLRHAIVQDDRLSVDVLDDLSKLATTDLSPYRAVVMHFKNYDANIPGRAGFDVLSKYVHDGGGLVLVHFACGAFQEFKGDFKQLVGRVWDPNLRGHDPRGLFTVRLADHDHPITAGMSDFQTNDELYTCLSGDVPIHPLAIATSKVDHKDYPMAFTLSIGKGRVFHSVLGHDVEALSVPAVGELYCRATAWVAGLQPVNQEHKP